MSLADLLADRIAAPEDKPCPVAALLASLEPRDAAALRAAMEPRRMGSDVLKSLLGQSNIGITEQDIQRHKRVVRIARGMTYTGLRCSCDPEVIRGAG